MICMWCCSPLCFVVSRCIALHCIALHCIVLYYIVLYHIINLNKLITHTGDKETNTVRSEMQAPYRLLQASARNIAKVFKDAKLECDEEEYVKGFNAGKYNTRTPKFLY